MQNLLPYDPAALAHHQQVVAHIHDMIVAAGGAISFAQFMELALYAPGLGYYSAGAYKLGKEGDFITAPELSPYFSRCIARQCQQVLAEITNGEILELGAGSGSMAAEILLELERQNYLPTRYAILDLSADLRQRQQQTLKTKCPHLLDRVIWLDALPSQTFNGIILANEVLDAMPIARFYCDNNGAQELYVGRSENKAKNPFCWRFQPVSAELSEKVSYLRGEYFPEEPEYISEINLALDAWINSLSKVLNQGLMLIIDYGFPQAEYYHPQRSQGTLMCHYQHRAHGDPLILVGLQDITAHVDFTAVANAAAMNQLQIAGYTSQAAFLLSCGIHEMAVNLTTIQQLDYANQIKKLTLPSEMGELFKVIALTKDLALPLLGFAFSDRRGLL